MSREIQLVEAKCRTCGRVKPDAARLPTDPPGAVTALTECPDCGDGPKEIGVVYIGASGEVIQ